jgi:hypothetical protein
VHRRGERDQQALELECLQAPDELQAAHTVAVQPAREVALVTLVQHPKAAPEQPARAQLQVERQGVPDAGLGVPERGLAHLVVEPIGAERTLRAHERLHGARGPRELGPGLQTLRHARDVGESAEFLDEVAVSARG